MLSCSDMAIFLRHSAERTRAEMTETTKELLDDAKQVARSLIGQELAEWPALSATTVAEKQRLGFTGQVSSTDPLLRTGELRESIRSSAEATGSGAEGVIGSSSKIALYQEVGTSKIPPRPFTSIALMRAQPQAERDFGRLGVQLTTPTVRR